MTNGILLRRQTVGWQCLAYLLLSVLMHLPVRSSQASSNPYKWKMSCFDFIEARYKLILDEDLPLKNKMNLINYFLSKVEEECDNIHLH